MVHTDCRIPFILVRRFAQQGIHSGTSLYSVCEDTNSDSHPGPPCLFLDPCLHVSLTCAYPNTLVCLPGLIFWIYLYYTCGVRPCGMCNGFQGKLVDLPWFDFFRSLPDVQFLSFAYSSSSAPGGSEFSL